MAKFAGKVRPLTREEFEEQIEAVRRARPDVAQHFGVRGLNLKTDHWSVYIRQSLKEQSRNNRVAEYLLSAALEAFKLNVVVPIEYILYDHETGEHMERPVFLMIRQELIAKRRIAGIISPKLDRLSRIPSHIADFERRCEHVRVIYWFGDVPNGTDPISKSLRQSIAIGAQFVLHANRENARSGSIGRIIKGGVPAGRAAFGYVYCPIPESDKRAAWRLDAVQEGALVPFNAFQLSGMHQLTNYFVEGSQAHSAAIIFYLAAVERRSSTYIVNYLIEHGSLATQGVWRDTTIRYILHNTIYYGVGMYNTKELVENPDHAVNDDITAKPRRTVAQPKPQSEWHAFSVPALVDKATWDAAQLSIADASRWRGRSKPRIETLLRGFILCPKCGNLMKYCGPQPPKVRFPYYRCSKRLYRHDPERCEFNKCIRADIAEERAKQALLLILTQPEVLQRAAEQIINSDIEGGGVANQAKYWLSKEKEANAELKRIQRGFIAGILSESEAALHTQQAREKLEEAQQKARQAQRALENRTSILKTLEGIGEELRQLGPLILDDIPKAHIIMNQLECAYIPDPDGSGEGKLYAFYSDDRPHPRYGPQRGFHLSLQSVRLGL